MPAETTITSLPRLTRKDDVVVWASKLVDILQRELADLRASAGTPSALKDLPNAGTTQGP